MSLDRRQVLTLAAMGAAGAVAFGAVQGNAAGPPAPRVRKALKIGMVQLPGKLHERFATLREIGYEGVELDSPSELDPQEVLDACKQTGLLVPGVVDSVHWRDTLSDPDPAVRKRGREALEHALRQCKLFGGSSVLLVPAVVNASVAYDQAYARSQAEIRAVLPLAAELQVRILIENVWNGFLLSPLEAARYTDELDSPWIGWHFDIGNVVNSGWPEQWIRVLGKRIHKLDVKEYSRKKRDEQGLWKGFEVEIGEGDCGWPAVRAALDEIGYRGWAAAEVGGGDRKRLEDIARRMDRVLN